MIQLYFGDGKGKTTAAVGAAVRAAGRGRKVIFSQFLKGQQTGEIGILSVLASVRILRFDHAFPFYAQMTEAQKQELTDFHNRMLDEIYTAVSDKTADFIVLDEITHASRLQMIDEEKLDRILERGKGEKTEIILTGRGPSEKLLEQSDYISEIRCIRHPYEKGTGARDGIER